MNLKFIEKGGDRPLFNVVVLDPSLVAGADFRLIRYPIAQRIEAFGFLVVKSEFVGRPGS